MLVLGSFFIGDTLIYCTKCKPRKNSLKGVVRIPNLPKKVQQEISQASMTQFDLSLKKQKQKTLAKHIGPGVIGVSEPTLHHMGNGSGTGLGG